MGEVERVSAPVKTASGQRKPGIHASKSAIPARRDSVTHLGRYSSGDTVTVPQGYEGLTDEGDFAVPAISPSSVVTGAA